MERTGLDMGAPKRGDCGMKEKDNRRVERDIDRLKKKIFRR